MVEEGWPGSVAFFPWGGGPDEAPDGLERTTPLEMGCAEKRKKPFNGVVEGLLWC